MTKNLIIFASFWAVAGFFAGQLVRLAGNLLLTRLLVPEAFGLMALVAIVIQGLEMFSDLGINTSLIQNRRSEDPVFRNTAWTLKIVRGFGMSLCLGLMAYPISHFYEEPTLWPILTAMMLVPLCAGFGSVAPAMSNRNLWLGRLTAINLSTQIASTAFMLAWAFLSPSVWALVAGNILGAILNAVLGYVCLPSYRERIHWNRQAAHEIYRFGKWIFLTGILVFLAGQLDRLTLAKLVPLHLVGIYSIGFMWAILPLQVVQTWMGRVLFPLAAEIFRDPTGDRLRLQVYRRRVVWLSAIGIGLFGGLITPIYRLLYTPEYWPATQFLEIILFGSLIRIFDEPYRAFNLALGQPKYTAIGAGVSILLFGATVIPLYTHLSAHGIAIAYAISQAGSLAAAAFGVRRAKLSDLRMDAVIAVVALAIWAVVYYATVR